MRTKGKPSGHHSDADDRAKTAGGAPLEHARATTSRPASHSLDDLPDVPEELTGRASTTREKLTTLFSNRSDAHLADGFRGGSGDDPDAGVVLRDDSQALEASGDNASDDRDEAGAKDGAR